MADYLGRRVILKSKATGEDIECTIEQWDEEEGPVTVRMMAASGAETVIRTFQTGEYEIVRVVDDDEGGSWGKTGL